MLFPFKALGIVYLVYYLFELSCSNHHVSHDFHCVIPYPVPKVDSDTKFLCLSLQDILDPHFFPLQPKLAS